MKSSRSIALLLVILLTFPTPALFAQGAKPAAGKFGNIEGITAAQMKDYLTFIASDELEGRDTPSRGLDIAALYLATNLARWGLKPAGENGTYFQPIALKRNKIDPSLAKVEYNGQSFAYGDDFLSSLNAGQVTAPLIYVSHGWFIKSKNINPYQGIDIKDKIVITQDALPKGVTFADLQGKIGEDWANGAIYAARNGAKGVITIPSFQALANWANARRAPVETGTVIVEAFQKEGPGLYGNPATLPAIIASPRLLALLFQGEKYNGTTIFSRAAAGEPVEAFDLKPEKKVTLNIAVKTDHVTTKNVVAVLEGSDPVLKNEYVAIGAHYDHVGIGNPVNGDAIYNGADDDGSGTVAVLSMAEAFAKGPRPKRSILFVWHAGEEKGLWGAQYFTTHPTVPIKQVIAQLNIDMIGRSKQPGDTKPVNQGLPEPGEIYVIGSKMMSTELGEVSEMVNKSLLNLKFNYKYDAPNDPNKFFFRSDHFHYAKQGVPIIFYMDGEHEDYHQPSDHIEKIDFAQMEKVARTIFATAWELASRPTRPKVDKQLPAELMGN
jgi:Zn-dependent M28 family amino/carboxypeptidase